MKNKKRSLSFGRVAKLGIDSVKAKPIRFAITIILFFVCLSIIGWSFSVAYVDIPTAALRAYNTYEEDEIGLYRVLNRGSRLESNEVNQNFNETDVEQIEDTFPSFQFDKLYEMKLGTYGFQCVNFIEYYANGTLDRCVVADENFLNRYGYRLLYGRLPKDESEIAIPKYFFELYQHYGYQDKSSGKKIQFYGYDENISKIKIEFEDLNRNKHQVSVVGVVDTNFKSEKFELLKRKQENIPEEDWENYKNLVNQFYFSVHAGAQNAGFVHLDFVKRYINGFDVNARVLDRTELLDFAFRGNASPYSDAQGKNLNRVIDSEEEGLKQDEMFAPLSFLKKRFDSEMTKEEVAEAIRTGLTLKMKLGSNQVKTYKVVGFYEDTISDVFIVEDSEYASAFVRKQHQTVSGLLTKLSDDQSTNKKLLAFGISAYDSDYNCYLDGLAGESAGVMRNVKETTSEMLPLLCSVTIIFSALMMFNFISATIAAKKKEIGILRALGAKNGAVYGIFASESVFTAIVSFLASIFGSILLNFLFNDLMNFTGGYVWFLTYGIAEAATVLFIGSGIALIGSLIPILRLIRKKPMEILR